MAWSTRQLAALADTTVKAVRYYHRIGLLEEPERTSNGYKQYEVEHLVRLLQIRRLGELGVPLSEVAATGSVDDVPASVIRDVDAELAATIARLQAARDDLADTLRHRAPAHLPSAFAPLAGGLSDRQKSLLMVYSSVLAEDSVEEFRRLVSESNPIEDEFEALPEDAGREVVEDLAARMVPMVLGSRDQLALADDGTAESRRARSTMAEAVVQLYNPAQLRVLRRLHELLAEGAAEDPASG